MKGPDREQGDVFGLSFMDCICCGFGAILLLFIITTMEETESQGAFTQDISAEIDRAENKLAQDSDKLATIKDELQQLQDQIAQAEQRKENAEAGIAESQGRLNSLVEQKGAKDAELKEILKDREAKAGELTSILEELAKPVEGLASTGKAVSKFEGDGRRHYVTGMKVDGARALFLVDMSSSMLGDSVSEARQYRGITDPSEIYSRKWIRTLDTMDWLMATMESQLFQVILFNENTQKALGPQSNDWLKASDPRIVDQVSSAMWNVVPSGGSNLERALAAAASLSPRPEVVYLLTDSLPTHSNAEVTGSQVRSSARVAHFLATRDEVKKLRAPINVILFHFEGDPTAGGYYWRMADQSRGSLFSPAPDWPN